MNAIRFDRSIGRIAALVLIAIAMTTGCRLPNGKAGVNHISCSGIGGCLSGTTIEQEMVLYKTATGQLIGIHNGMCNKDLWCTLKIVCSTVTDPDGVVTGAMDWDTNPKDCESEFANTLGRGGLKDYLEHTNPESAGCLDWVRSPGEKPYFDISGKSIVDGVAFPCKVGIGFQS